MEKSLKLLITIEIEAVTNGNWNQLTLSNVWYVLKIKMNLYYVLPTHDKIPNSMFKSTSEVCNFKIINDVILVGIRDRFERLFKLVTKSVKSHLPIKTNEVDEEDLL